jgi:hypothetical protein
MGVYALRIERRSANKSCSSGWVCLVKFYLWGAHSNPEPAGTTHFKGVYALRIERRPANKSCSSRWVCIVKLYFEGLTPTWSLQGPPTSKGVYAFSNFPEIYQVLLISPGLYERLVALPHSRPSPRPAIFLCLGPLDQSARDFFTMKLWNSPRQRRGAQLVINNIMQLPLTELLPSVDKVPIRTHKNSDHENNSLFGSPSSRFFSLKPDYLLISAMVRINLFLKGTLSTLAIDVKCCASTVPIYIRT